MNRTISNTIGILFCASAVLADPIVTFPHDQQNPQEYISIHYEYSSFALDPGDTLVVIASISNISDAVVCVNPKFQLHRIRYEPSQDVSDSLQSIIPEPFERCRATGTINMQAPSREEAFGCCWTILNPGSAVVDTITVPYPKETRLWTAGTTIYCPIVFFQTPVEEIDLPFETGHYRVAEDSVAVRKR